ncbi:hypothetical protein LG3211_4658 [Lysobacter gummosus]|nr:hypothetical protein LG3211_4658 [Lysobacter gummosus]
MFRLGHFVLPDWGYRQDAVPASARTVTRRRSPARVVRSSRNAPCR